MEQEDILKKFRDLSKRKNDLMVRKNTIETILKTHKDNLKNEMAKCKEEGFDPSSLEDEIDRNTQILTVKLDSWESELSQAEKIISSIEKEIGVNELL